MPRRGNSRTKILSLGLNAIIAKVHKGRAVDNKECILDYSIPLWWRSGFATIRGSSLSFISAVYWDKKRLIDFV
jgi:hypothetical protein